MTIAFEPDHEDEYPRAVGHAMGYLAMVAACPPLAVQLVTHHVAAMGLALLLLVAILRTYMRTLVRDALSPLRARYVLTGVDQAAACLVIASACAVFALASVDRDALWAGLLGFAALLAAGLSAQRLFSARRTWHSSTFLSRLE